MRGSEMPFGLGGGDDVVERERIERPGDAVALWHEHTRITGPDGEPPPGMGEAIALCGAPTHIVLQGNPDYLDVGIDGRWYLSRTSCDAATRGDQAQLAARPASGC